MNSAISSVYRGLQGCTLYTQSSTAAETALQDKQANDVLRAVSDLQRSSVMSDISQGAIILLPFVALIALTNVHVLLNATCVALFRAI